MDKLVIAGKPKAKSTKEKRAVRLAIELRANLKRRKAAAWGRENGEEGPPDLVKNTEQSSD